MAKVEILQVFEGAGMNGSRLDYGQQESVDLEIHTARGNKTFHISLWYSEMDMQPLGLELDDEQTITKKESLYYGEWDDQGNLIKQEGEDGETSN